MEALLMGLLLFLGLHSVRIWAAGWRDNTIEMLGGKGYRLLFTAGSVLGLGLIVWGYGQARLAPMVLWQPPVGMRHLALLLTWAAFVLATAAYVPGNPIQARIGHPLVAGTKVWALAHLLSNGNLADVLLFGAFLVWAVFDFASLRRRDRGTARAPVVMRGRGVLTLLIGSVAWAIFAWGLHGWLIGVRPLP